MLQNEYLDAKIGVNTGENEPSEDLKKSVKSVRAQEELAGPDAGGAGGAGGPPRQATREVPEEDCAKYPVTAAQHPRIRRR